MLDISIIRLRSRHIFTTRVEIPPSQILFEEEKKRKKKRKERKSGGETFVARKRAEVVAKVASSTLVTGIKRRIS